MFNLILFGLFGVSIFFDSRIEVFPVFASAQKYSASYNVCLSGALTNSHNTISLTEKGALYYAESCAVNAVALVNLDAQESPSLSGAPFADKAAEMAARAQQRIVASFNNGQFAEGSQILAIFPLAENVDTAVPIEIHIQANTFGTNAVIRFYGSFPSRSKIIITGNTLQNVNEVSRSPTMASQIAGILGWQSNKNILIREECKIEISENNVNVATTNTQYEARGIGIWSYAYMGKSSSISINSNTVTVSAVRGKFNGGIDTFAYIAEGPDTYYEIINNQVTVSNGFAIGSPFARYPETEADESRFPTRVLVSRNYGTVNRAVYFPTSKADGDVIFVGNSKNSLSSTIELSHNNFKVTNSDANIRVAQTELLNTASVKVISNTLTTTGGNPRIIFSWNVTAFDDSKVIVAHNTLRRTDAVDFFPGCFFLFYRGYNLYNRS